MYLTAGETWTALQGVLQVHGSSGDPKIQNYHFYNTSCKASLFHVERYVQEVGASRNQKGILRVMNSKSNRSS